MFDERKAPMPRPHALLAGSLVRVVAGLRRRTAASPRPHLPRGEWVLISEHDTPRNRQVLATRHAVYYQSSPWELEPWCRLGWDQIQRIDWDAEHAQITFVHGVMYQRPNLVLQLGTDLRFLDLARERITATTVLRVPLYRCGQPVGWLTARRRADGRGDVRWMLGPDDVSCPPEEVAQAIRQISGLAGL
ncbi:hypothetical protein AB0M54_37640 [Actinoplanes sp. NPDC051470]|uniref:hypothetical protein n=1 Tax=unclassified Actinoplanes TaxID=2626549 RepID=UPI00341526BB